MKSIAAIALLSILLVGCDQTTQIPVVTPDSKPVLGAHEKKDETIKQAANNIDKTAETKAPAVAPEVRTQTDAIREAIAAAPAAQIDALSADFRRAITALESQVKEAEKARQKAEERAKALEDAEMKAQARTLRFVALGLLLVSGVLFYGRQVQFALVATAAALLLFGLAQLISQPWFMWACTGVCIIILASLAYAGWKSYQKGTIGDDVAREKERLSAALKKIVPALDEAQDELDDAAKQALRSTLARLMDDDHKALVHEVRAALKKKS